MKQSNKLKHLAITATAVVAFIMGASSVTTNN